MNQSELPQGDEWPDVSECGETRMLIEWLAQELTMEIEKQTKSF